MKRPPVTVAEIECRIGAANTAQHAQTVAQAAYDANRSVRTLYALRDASMAYTRALLALERLTTMVAIEAVAA